MLIRSARTPGTATTVDLRLDTATIREVAPQLTPEPGEEVLDASGTIAIPGLWDQHVHVGQTAQGYARLDTSGVLSVEALLDLVRGALAGRPASAGTLVGFGHRLVGLSGTPTVSALDAVSGDVPVVLIGVDAHHAWMNSAALRGLGLPPQEGIVGEDPWFDAVAHLDDLPGVADAQEHGVERMQRDALALGVVGICDMEWAANWELWARREALLHVRTATYPSTFDRAPHPSGTPVDASGLVTMGPLKVIADGALGSRSARCRHAYGGQGADGHGILNIDPDRLVELLRSATAKGLWAAVHAIGDEAAEVALDAYEAAGERGRIEHAQMLTDTDLARMARLGLIASVQPAHLLDDRDPTSDIWADIATEAFRFRDMLDAGISLAFGSDAPVAPIDPWLAMAAAVHRSADARDAWFPHQQLQPREALDASTDGVRHLAAGGPADVVLLDSDPFDDVPLENGLMPEHASREAAERLRATRVLATVVAGRVAFRA